MIKGLRRRQPERFYLFHQAVSSAGELYAMCTDSRAEGLDFESLGFIHVVRAETSTSPHVLVIDGLSLLSVKVLVYHW